MRTTSPSRRGYAAAQVIAALRAWAPHSPIRTGFLRSGMGVGECEVSAWRAIQAPTCAAEATRAAPTRPWSTDGPAGAAMEGLCCCWLALLAGGAAARACEKVGGRLPGGGGEPKQQGGLQGVRSTCEGGEECRRGVEGC